MNLDLNTDLPDSKFWSFTTYYIAPLRAHLPQHCLHPAGTPRHAVLDITHRHESQLPVGTIAGTSGQIYWDAKGHVGLSHSCLPDGLSRVGLF